MKAISYYFDYGYDDRWSRMAKVLEYSCLKFGLECEVIKIQKPKMKGGYKVNSNHEKLKMWNDEVQKAEEPIILLDADIFCTENPSHVLDKFDHVAITYRDQTNTLPFNGGVIFVKPTPEAKQLFQDWVDADMRLFQNRAEHLKWKAKYAGMNQASLGCLMETKYVDSNVITKLPCSKYNLVEPWWRPDEACFIHIKAHAGHHIFSNCKTKNQSVITVKDMWLKLEEELDNNQ